MTLLSIPLLLNHDHTRVIGQVNHTGTALHVKLERGQGLTRDQVFAIFGNVGVRWIEAEGPLLPSDRPDGGVVYLEFEILEWSLCPFAPAQPG